MEPVRAGATAAPNAAKFGFKGLGLWHADIEHQLETSSLNEMKQIFDDAGLQYLQVEFLADFFVAPGDPLREDSDKRRKLLFDTAATFDAHHIKVGNIPGTPCELDVLVESFAELCQDAANHTNAKVAYEFMPFDVNVNTLDTALTLATDVKPAKRRPCDRHLAHGQARHSAG